MLTIKERVIGDVTVLDLIGKVLIGDGDYELQDHVHHLVGRGRTKVVLNLATTPYIDSSGSGAIVHSFTTVSKAGGKLKVLNPSQKIRDLYAITKLNALFEVFEDEAEAVASFGVDRFLSVCPVCGFAAAFATLGPSRQTCTSCTAEFVFASQEAQRAREVEQIVLSTYDGERVFLRRAWPYELSLEGRLDLFAAEAIEQVWRAVPSPRKALIELGTECQVVTPRGLKALADLCGPEADGGRTLALLHGHAMEMAEAVGYAGPFLRDRAAALVALEVADSQVVPIWIEAART